MKILQVIPYFVPAWGYGGPLTVAYNLSKELVKRGHQVVVYTTDTLDAKHRAKETEEIIDGIQVRRFRNVSNYIANRHNICFSPGMLFAIKKELPDFDIIHLYEHRTFQNIFIHYYARKYNIPYVAQVDGSLGRGSQKQLLKELFDVLFGYDILEDASRLIAITPTEALAFGMYSELGGESSKIVLIPNSIDFKEYEHLPDKGSFRKQYGIREEHIILFLGRIHKIKGINILVEAVADLIREGLSLRLVIAGHDCGYLDELRKLTVALHIDGQTTFTGFICGQTKLAAYMDADVYVLPSIYETFPMTVLESLACATPVIVTNRCQIANLVQDHLGLVVPHDKDDLRDAILKMLTDKELRAEFAWKGRLLVKEQYNHSRRTGAVEALYKEIIMERMSK